MTQTRTIRPSDFIQAEATVKQQLESLGYVVQDSGYETYFCKSSLEKISQINKPTSLYIRTLPDKVIIGSKESLLLEIKDASEPNIALEAFPIVIHRQLFWSFNIQTLYVFVRDSSNISCEFVENIKVDRVIIPKRLRTAEIKYWKPLLQQSFPENSIENIPTGGSGDPFVIIFEKHRNKLKRFEDILI